MFSGLENPVHLLVLLLIVLLLFGPRRLPELGRSLGRGMRELRSSLGGEKEGGEPVAAEPADEVKPAKGSEASLAGGQPQAPAPSDPPH